MARELAVLIPVLDRPHRVEPTLKSIRSNTPGKPRVLFIADENDGAELEALERQDAEFITVPRRTNYAAKINAGYAATDEPLFFMAADDLNFHPDWFPRAMAHMVPGVEVVGTNDICNPRVMCGQHSTHTLVRRSYVEERSGVVDEPGKVLHEGYAHEYTDDEFIQTAMAREVYAHAFDSIVEHLHPLVDKSPDDATYQRGRLKTRYSRRLFQQRRQLWMSPS